MSQSKPFKLQIKPSTRNGKVIKLTVSSFEEHVRNIDGFKLTFSQAGENTAPEIIAVQTVREGIWTEVKGTSIKQLGVHLYAELTKNAEHLSRFVATGELYINVDEITEDIGNKYSQSLTEIIESDNIRITESVFRAYYAPFFTLQPSEVSDPEYNEKYLAAIRRWKIEVAGMSNDVDVIDQSGAVLFTVPSLSMRADINFTGDTSIYSIHDEHAYRSELNPADGDMYLEQELSKSLKMDEEAQRNGMKEAIQMINKIRLYYGRGPLFGDSEAKSDSSKSSSDQSEEFDGSDFVDF